MIKTPPTKAASKWEKLGDPAGAPRGPVLGLAREAVSQKEPRNKHTKDPEHLVMEYQRVTGQEECVNLF